MMTEMAIGYAVGVVVGLIPTAVHNFVYKDKPDKNITAWMIYSLCIATALIVISVIHDA